MPESKGHSHRVAFTQHFIDKLDASKITYVVDYYDLHTRCLNLRLSPPSRTNPAGLKTGRFLFRLDGKPHILTFGHCPPWSYKMLKDAAAEAQVAVNRRQDPRLTFYASKAPEQQAAAAVAAAAPVDTIEKMFERYRRKLDTRSDKHRRATTAYFVRFVLPMLGGLDVHSLKKRQLVDLLATVRDSSGPVSANRCATAISAWLNFLVGEGILDASPGTKLPKNEEKERTQTLTIEQLVRVWTAAGTLGPVVGNFIRLLIALPVRRDEASGLPRSEVDGDLWLLPSTRNKSGRDFAIKLPTLAKSILAACPNTGRFYFSRTGQRPLTGFYDAKQALDAAIAAQPGPALPAWTYHDLRRSTASHLAAKPLSIPRETIELVLNHARPKLQRTYNCYDYADEIGEVLQAWSDHIGPLVDPNYHNGGVAPEVLAAE